MKGDRYLCYRFLSKIFCIYLQINKIISSLELESWINLWMLVKKPFMDAKLRPHLDQHWHYIMNNCQTQNCTVNSFQWRYSWRIYLRRFIHPIKWTEECSQSTIFKWINAISPSINMNLYEVKYVLSWSYLDIIKLITKNFYSFSHFLFTTEERRGKR